MKSVHKTVFAALLTALLAAPAGAATFDDPDWPCIQRRVDSLSVGQMWPGPFPETDWRVIEALRTLGPALAQRRVSVEEVGERAAAYADTLPEADRAEHMALLFTAILEQINAQRAQLISGVGRYARRQAALAERVDQRRAEIAALMDAEDKDFDRIDAVEEALEWDTRIFRERAQSLSYVCEAPVLLEQRAFAIARILAGLI
jgi:hypothetical protein